jgi:hypothetical protein
LAFVIAKLSISGGKVLRNMMQSDRSVVWRSRDANLIAEMAAVPVGSIRILSYPSAITLPSFLSTITAPYKSPHFSPRAALHARVLANLRYKA